MLRRLTTVGRTAGWNDIGIHNPSMHTPAIDKLAGVRSERTKAVIKLLSTLFFNELAGSDTDERAVQARGHGRARLFVLLLLLLLLLLFFAGGLPRAGWVCCRRTYE